MLPSSSDFDLSRVSNAGKEAARIHKQMRKLQEKLEALTDEAIAAGVSDGQFEHALLRFCNGREEVTDAASLWMAVQQVRNRKESAGVR